MATKTTGNKRRGATRKGKHLTKGQKSDVKKIIAAETEMKYNNYNFSQVTVGTTAQFDDISANLIQGISDLQRVGDRVKLTGSAYLRLFVHGGQPTQGFDYIRFILFQWRQDSATAPLVADILLNGSSGSPDYTSAYNHDKRSLYNIFYDETFELLGSPVNSEPPQSNYAQHRVLTLKVPLKQVQYIGGGTTGMNHIYALYMSGSAAANPSLFYTFKYMFTDS